MNNNVKIGVAVTAAVFAGMLIGNGIGSTDAPKTTQAAPVRAVPQTSATPAREPEPINEFGPGMLKVGTQIPPGTYVTEAGEGLLGSCYWARLKDAEGTLDSIISNDNVEGSGVVTIKSSDAYFETRCTWKPEQ